MADQEKVEGSPRCQLVQGWAQGEPWVEMDPAAQSCAQPGLPAHRGAPGLPGAQRELLLPLAKEEALTEMSVG